MSKLSVWVREVGVLHADKDVISTWEVWGAFNTKREAEEDLRHDFEKRPSWVTAKFHRMTNRIRKYVPEVSAQ